MEYDYKVSIRRDTEMMKTFVKFNNRVHHPRVSFHMFLIGILLISIPIVGKDGKLVGVVICYILGCFLVLMSLFRHYIAVYHLKKSPETQVGEEITYCFSSRGVKIYQNNSFKKNLGNYKKMYRMWEDETHYYIGMNEEDLLLLPFADFETGDPKEFKNYILGKGDIEYTWLPKTLKNYIKKTLATMKMREVEHDAKIAEEKEKKRLKKEKKNHSCRYKKT